MLDVIFIGLSLGSILLMVALGLAITYGAMGVINMAHGDLVMVGAYTTVMSRIWLHLGFLAAIPVAFVVTALIGLAIERLIVRHLYGRLLDTLLATWGVAILLQQAVRLEFGASFFGRHIEGLGTGLQKVNVPDWMTGSITIGDADINIYRAVIIVIALIMTAVTWFIMYRTSIGMQVRAIMRNPKMAAACGINVDRVNALTFAYGSGLAGIAGRADVGLQDGLSRHGHAARRRRLPCRGRGRRRQPLRVARGVRIAWTDQRLRRRVFE